MGGLVGLVGGSISPSERGSDDSSRWSTGDILRVNELLMCLGCSLTKLLEQGELQAEDPVGFRGVWVSGGDPTNVGRRHENWAPSTFVDLPRTITAATTSFWLGKPGASRTGTGHSGIIHLLTSTPSTSLLNFETS